MPLDNNIQCFLQREIDWRFRLKDNAKQYAFLFVLAGTIIALDQWTKYLVRTLIPRGQIWSPWEWLTPFARIVHWDNSGVAFGLFQGTGSIFLVLALVVGVVIIYYYPRVASNDWVLKVALAMQLGGALGNVIDRIFFAGRVTDFISIGDFPVFNVADSSISVGVCVLLLGVWLQERRAEKKNPDEAVVAAVEETANQDEISS
jgi:signal peptidase II